MFKKICVTPLCAVKFETEFNQKQYCPACRKRRAGVLELFRMVKKQTECLHTFIDSVCDVAVLYQSNTLILNLHHDNGFSMRMVLNEHTELEAKIVLRNVLRAYKYIVQNKSKFREVIDVEKV